MNAIDFCFWLQGYFEITGNGASNLSEEQVKAIRNHLNLVFKHEIDPLRDKQTTTPASTLNQAHGNDPKMRC